MAPRYKAFLKQKQNMLFGSLHTALIIHAAIYTYFIMAMSYSNKMFMKLASERHARQHMEQNPYIIQNMLVIL
jgi:hypothetical protein